MDTKRLHTMKIIFVFAAAIMLSPLMAEAQTYSSCPDDNHPHTIDLGLDDGTIWACCNVGATAPEEYGDYFSWGETSTKEEYEWTTYMWYEGSGQTEDLFAWTESENRLTKYNYNEDYGVVDNKYELDLEDDAAYMNWGNSWRMPSNKQLAHLLNNTIHEEVTIDDVLGMKLTSKKNGNSIFMPYSGYRKSVGIYFQNYDYKYWTRTLAPNSELQALHAIAMGTYTCYYPRELGLAVRPVAYKAPTGIQTISSKCDYNDKYYTLNGMMLESKPSKKGVYIINGHKCVVK